MGGRFDWGLTGLEAALVVAGLAVVAGVVGGIIYAVHRI